MTGSSREGNGRPRFQLRHTLKARSDQTLVHESRMVCNREQRVACTCPYTQHMQTAYLKAALMAAWILAVGSLAYMSGTTSFAGWTVAAVLSLVPLAVMARLWSAPAPSMSETIRDVLR